jgi:hypothetical protein
MKVTITENEVYVETEEHDMPVDREHMIDWSCRLAAQEATAWAIKRLGEELEKSVSFYRTGQAVDHIGID